MPYAGSGNATNCLQSLRAELDEGVLTITLNSPAQGSASSGTPTMELQSLLTAVASDTDVRVVVLRDAGDEFCAAVGDGWRGRQLRQLPQPVIGMVHGHCKRGALAVLANCDIVLVSDDAQFTLTQFDTDLLADAALARSAASVMTPRAARYHALSGQAFDGREAERNGLASRSVSPAQLEQETNALAHELAGKDAIALQFTKETLQHVGSMSWDGVLSYTAAKFAELKALQAGRPSARAAAVEGFLAGKSKPGLGG